MENFLTNTLIGIRRWVNYKLERITFVIANHIVEIEDSIESLDNKIKNIGFVIATHVNNIVSRLDKDENKIKEQGHVIATHVNDLTTKVDKNTKQVKDTGFVVANHINNITTRLDQDEERMNDMDEVISAVLVDHENRIPEHITKQIHVDSLLGYFDNGHVELSEYGLSSDDVQMFIDGKLTVNVVADVLLMALSMISEPLYLNIPKPIKTLIGKMYQSRLSTSVDTVETEINPISNLVTLYKDLDLDSYDISLKSYPGNIPLLNYLISIKHSILAMFEQPRISLRLSSVTKYEMTKTPYESYNSEGLEFTPDIVVTDNKIIFLGVYPGILIDDIDKNIDNMLDLPEDTFYNLTTAEVLYECYGMSCDEAFIETLPGPMQVIVRTWKTNIESMATWNGYNNIYEFISAINYLESEYHNPITVTIDDNDVQVDTDSTYYEQREDHQEYDTDLYYAPYYKEGETAEMYSVINAFPLELVNLGYVDEYYTTCVPESEYIS